MVDAIPMRRDTSVCLQYDRSTQHSNNHLSIRQGTHVSSILLIRYFYASPRTYNIIYRITLNG